MKDLVLAVKKKDREGVNRFIQKNDFKIQDFKDVSIGGRHIFWVMARHGWIEELALFLKDQQKELPKIGVTVTEVAVGLRESSVPIQKIFDFSPDFLLKDQDSLMRWWWKSGWGKPCKVERLKESLLFIEQNITGAGKEAEKDVAVEYALHKAKGKVRPMFVKWMKEEGVFERYKVDWVAFFPKESLEFARKCEIEKCFESDFFLSTLAQQNPTKDWLSLMEFFYSKSPMKKEIKNKTEEIIHDLLRNLPRDRINHLAKFIKTNKMGFNKSDLERWTAVASLCGNIRAVWSWSKEFDIDLSSKVGLMEDKLGLGKPAVGSLWFHLADKLSEKEVGDWLQKTALNEVEWARLLKDMCLNEDNPEKWLPKLTGWGFKITAETYEKEEVEPFVRIKPSVEQWVHGELLKSKFSQEKPKAIKRAL
jgi:hypothetical protein